MTRMTDIRIPVTADEKAQIEMNVRDVADANGLTLPSMAAIVRAVLLNSGRKTKLPAGSLVARRKRAAHQEVR